MKTIQDVQKNILIKYHKLSEDQAQEVIDMLSALDLKISDVYVNNNTDPVNISLNYHFYISKAIESGQLRNLRVWVKGDRAYVVIHRDGLGEFRFSLHKSEVERKNQNWQSMPETMLKKSAIKRAIKLVFADLYSSYEIINLASQKKENKKQNVEAQFYQKDYSKKVANVYAKKSADEQNQDDHGTQKKLSSTRVSAQDNEENKNDEITKLRKEIYRIMVKNKVSKEEFKKVIREAKDLIFSDPEYELVTEHDYVRLKNFLEKKYESV